MSSDCGPLPVGKTSDWASWAAARGYRMVCGDAAIVEEVRAEIEDRADTGELSAAVFDPFLAPMPYLRGHARPARVILVAVPLPIYELSFETPRGNMTLLLPPNYGSEVSVPRRLVGELRELVGPEHVLTPLRAPFKAIAGRLGLATYGRNNLAFVEGLGTALQLAGFVTDAPLEPVTPPVSYPSSLERCSRCRACVKACPTEAVSTDRFLLRAERCISLHLESAGPLPGGLPVPSPACLLGCLACQLACPENRGVLRREPRGVFDAAETTALLEGRTTTSLAEKLDALDLTGYGVELLGRNLRWLLHAPAANLTAGRDGPGWQT